MNYKEKFIKMNQYMKDEEFPDTLNEFCEFIIQQNSAMANKFFTAHPEVTREFLKYFKPAKGKIFYRGGFPNLDRKILSASENKNVALNFAIHGNNYTDPEYKKYKGNREFHEMKAMKYYKPIWSVSNEEEVFLWLPQIISTQQII